MKFLAPFSACGLLYFTRLSAAFVQRTNHHRPAFALNVAATARTHYTNMTHHLPTTSDLQEFPEQSLIYDHYSGVAVHVEHLEGQVLTDPVAYSRVLESSLELWKMEQRRGIWIHIPKSHGHLIAVRYNVTCGFSTSWRRFRNVAHLLVLFISARVAFFRSWF